MKPLTIGHIDTELSWRGGEKQALELMKGLASKGQNNILFCRPGSKIGEKARACGIQTIMLPLRGEWDIVSAFNIRKEVSTQNIDILHTHTSHAHMIGLLALIGLSSCKLVVSRRVDFHIRSTFSRKLKYGAGVERIIAVSDAIKRILIEDGVKPDRIITIKSGFVPGQFTDNESGNLRNSLGISDNTIVVATVAALAPHKSHTDLLKAVSHLIKTHDDVLFLLAGEGKLYDVISEQIKNLNLESHVKLLGFVEDIATVYLTADIFALTSEEEGLCTSLLDAMYFGLPIVATSAGGIPELVHDNSNGFIVPVHDYMSFANRLQTLIESPDMRLSMGAESASILNKHTVSHTIAQTLELYHEIATPKDVEVSHE